MYVPMVFELLLLSLHLVQLILALRTVVHSPQFHLQELEKTSMVLVWISISQKICLCGHSLMVADVWMFHWFVVVICVVDWMMLMTDASTISMLGSRVSPVARMLLMPTMPTTTKGTPP